MKKITKYILILFLFCYLTNNSIAQHIIHLSQKTNHVAIEQGKLSFWEDQYHTKIAYNNYVNFNLNFKTLQTKQPNFGFTPNDVWFQFKLSNSSKLKNNFLLKINNPNLDKVELYKVFKNRLKFMSITGDLINFQQRPYKNRILTLPIQLNPKEKVIYVLKINNGTEHFNFSLDLVTGKRFNKLVYIQQYFLGAFFGILLFTLMFNIVVGFFIKEKTSLYYCLYISAFIVLQFSILGFAKEYLWPNNSYLSNHINPISATISIIFLLKFCMHYLNTKTFIPRINIILKYTQYPLIINLLIAFLPTSFCYTSSIIIINAITLILNIFIIGVALYAIYRKYRPAKIFFLAFFVLFISVFAFILKNFGIIPSNPFTDYGLQFGSIVEAILLTFGIIIRFKNVLEQNYEHILELNLLKDETNAQLEFKVKTRTAEIEFQKKEIEEKNKEIISSISYAKRIQEAILPHEEYMNSLLEKWALIYEPKDIVAGDFYWINAQIYQNEKWIYFAVADCTGHGVPGAMMSVLCYNALNTNLLKLNSPNTSELLEKTSQQIKENLSNSASNVMDGMDISVCCYNSTSKMLYWSGANNPLLILRNHEIIEIAPTKKPIGNSYSNEPFAQHAIQLLKQDTLIIFSDGITDQFGGDFNKKYKKSKLKETCLNSFHLNIYDKKEFIFQSFNDWKNKEEQIDDVCLLLVEIC
ncbi:MAG: SpoIIE family protein phosphatase [Flavobacteriia bacterium]|nr:SpoIIE family protein phosphatase [Flavobacteriia bacterium]